MGLRQSDHDPCVFYGQLDPLLPPIFVGLYVDDFKYWSIDDATEKIFEQQLSSKCTVEFMGEVSWFLGSKYEWETTLDGKLTVSITQTAKAESLIEAHGMENANPVKSPYKSGITIDRIPTQTMDPEEQKTLTTKYQGLIGGLLWLQRQTRPDISTVTRLLASHNTHPSTGHYQAAKHVLAYLKGTIDRGIRFTQGHGRTEGYVAIPNYDDDSENFPTNTGVYTDANWGPQDASHPKEGETVVLDEVQSLLGHVVFREGGPIVWGCSRESDTISRSSCESEIYAADEGTKSILTIRHLLQDLNMEDGFMPTPLYNDNRGCVDWTKGCTVSRKLRHVNMRNLGVRLAQKNQEIDMKHIPGKRNIADILTKEHKDVEHFRNMMKTITSPRRYADLVKEHQLNLGLTKGGVSVRQARSEALQA